MSSASDYDDLIETTYKYFEQFFDPESVDELALEEENSDAKLYVRRGEIGTGNLADASLIVCKGTLHTDDPEKPFNLFWKANDRLQWDDGYDHFETVEEVDENTNINHSAMVKPNMFISAREFCVVASKKYCEDKKLVIVQASTEHDKAPLYSSSHVRANTRTINIFEPNDNGEIDYTFLGQTDPNGSIPNWLINATISGAIKSIEKINSKI